MRFNRYVQIPDVITVHLGGKDTVAPNITLPFVDYLKGCAACLICPIWPEQAQRANIYAITSFALNRISSRWYRARGCDFDITASAQDDLPFNCQTCLFCNTSSLVEELFNNYLTRQGSGEPLLARLCLSGQTCTEIGVLYQDGAVAMAEKGHTYYDILKQYYGEDIAMIENALRQGERERFLGTPLMCGASGEDIRTIKRQLNRIGQNYPDIAPLNTDSVSFDPPCERAVRTFQYIFDLPVTGVLDKATWYSIKRTCAGIEQSDAALFEQKAVPAIRPISFSAPPASQETAEPNSSLRREFAEGKNPSVIVPGRLIPGNTLPSIVIPGDNDALDSVISDSGIAEKAEQESAWQGAPPESNAVENVARWSATRQSILQEAVDNNPLGSDIAPRVEAVDQVSSQPETESPISDSDVRAEEGAAPEGNAVENAARWSATRQSILQEAVDNNPLVSDIAPRVEAVDQVSSQPETESPISDSDVRAEEGAAPESSAVENAARWSATRQRILQEAANNIPLGSIITDRGIASRAEAASQIPGHPVSESPTDGSVLRMVGTQPEGSAIENAAQWSATREQILQSAGDIPPDSIITDRGIASRAEMAGQIPGFPEIERPEPERSPISDSDVREEEGAAPKGDALENEALFNAQRSAMFPAGTVSQRRVRQPPSPAERLVIGPSVSVPLPDAETGVDSGHAVEWLKQTYGI